MKGASRSPTAAQRRTVRAVRIASIMLGCQSGVHYPRHLMPITSSQAKFDWFFPYGRFFLRRDDSPSNLQEAGPGSRRLKPRGQSLQEAKLRNTGALEGGGFGKPKPRIPNLREANLRKARASEDENRLNVWEAELIKPRGHRGCLIMTPKSSPFWGTPAERSGPRFLRSRPPGGP